MTILVGLDFETYWDKVYSLRRVPMARYIRDPQFKAHGCAVKIGENPSKWVTGAKLPTFFEGLNRTPGVLIYGHNLKFDGAIAAWHYGVNPKMWIDTLGMSRAVLGALIPSHGLDAVAKYLGFGGKTKSYALANTLGVRDLSPETERHLGEYSCDDIDDTLNILKVFLKSFPKRELEVLDWTIRMFVEPRLVLNRPVLDALHEAEVERKRELLASLNLGDEATARRTINSNPQFAQMLLNLGVLPPMKLSPRTGKETFAFAAKDEEFVALTDHPDPRVAELVQIRLGTKSSIEETRARTYANVAGDGPWPVDLHYSGAMATHRLSGGKGGGGNVQNLGRKSMLRKAIMAPDGYVLIVADSSNIELRTSAALCGEWTIIETLASGGDLYSDFASQLFGYPVNKKDHPEERQVGKVAVLQLGYQSGDATFSSAYWAQTGKKLPDGESKRVVKVYRDTLRGFPATWKLLGEKLQLMANGVIPANLPSNPPLTWGVDFIEGPSGLRIKYPELRIETIADKKRGGVKQNLVYTSYSKVRGDGIKPIYGGMCLENLSQFMAREIITEQAVIVNRRYPVLMQVHDELVVLAPLAEEAECKAFVKQVMSTPPTWWPGMKVGCEVNSSTVYGEAK